MSPPPFHGHESPVSLRIISYGKKSGANGCSRIVQVPSQSCLLAMEGLDTVTTLIVRGGSPSENHSWTGKIPNINHFSTTGASGGQVVIMAISWLMQGSGHLYRPSRQAKGRLALSSVSDFLIPARQGTWGLSHNSLRLQKSPASSRHFDKKTSYLVFPNPSVLPTIPDYLIYSGCHFHPALTFYRMRSSSWKTRVWRPEWIQSHY